MDTVTYPHPKVVEAVSQHSVPVKINVLEQREPTKRFGVAWTPVQWVLRPGAEVPSRSHQGWLPPESFVAELELGLAYTHLQEKRFEQALALAREVVASGADGERRAEARYWEAVAHYRATGAIENLHAGYEALKRDFPGSAAARKLSFPAS